MITFPGGSGGKESTCNAGDLVSIPGSGRSPGEGNGNWLQYSCLKNPMHRGAWWATVHRFAKSQTWLSNWEHMMGSYDSSHSKFSFSFKTQNGSILIHDRNTKHHSKFLAIKYGISFALQDKQSFKVFYFNDICILLPRNTAVQIGCICALGHFQMKC